MLLFSMLKKHYTAIFALSLCCVSSLWAAPSVGQVRAINGTVYATPQQGVARTLAAQSQVFEGDTLHTEQSSFAQIQMEDGGKLVLRPQSRLLINQFRFSKEKPEEDSFAFSLLKGGLRAFSGLVGKRGNKNAYQGRAGTATVGIRGTEYDFTLCQQDCFNAQGALLPDGTYYQVVHGQIIINNQVGQLLVNAGEFGFAPLDGLTLPTLQTQNPLNYQLPKEVDPALQDSLLDGKTSLPDVVESCVIEQD